MTPLWRKNGAPHHMGSRSKDPKSPSVTVLKRLFAVAKNRCAFPACESKIIDGSGAIVGEVCHIAGRINGPRYDPEQPNSERHGYENLIVLCGTHHKIVDEQIGEYTIERLIEIKRTHEQGSESDVGTSDAGIKELFKRLKEELAKDKATLDPRTYVGNRMSVSLLRVIRVSTHGRSEEFVRYSFFNQTAESLSIPVWSIRWTDSRALDVARIWEHGYGRPHAQEYHLDADVLELEINPNTVVNPSEIGLIDVHLSQKSLIEPLGQPVGAWSFTDYLLPTDVAHKADVYVIFPQEGMISSSPNRSNSCSQIAHWESLTGRDPVKLTALLHIAPPAAGIDTTLLSRLNGYFDLSK